jgi:hypothetical protein
MSQWQLGGGGQQVVSVVCGVGLELFQHHLNRSSRSKPRTTWPDSGATATGLLL